MTTFYSLVFVITVSDAHLSFIVGLHDHFNQTFFRGIFSANQR